MSVMRAGIPRHDLAELLHRLVETVAAHVNDGEAEPGRFEIGSGLDRLFILSGSTGEIPVTAEQFAKSEADVGTVGSGICRTHHERDLLLLVSHEFMEFGQGQKNGVRLRLKLLGTFKRKPRLVVISKAGEAKAEFDQGGNL
ncbi:MAG: hypothetical protein BWY66_00089 [bacterium ADurb.Bin374]|nr:MAG: hypothetical protein BWY66_00089 [bacterium ADurb.Bin374]